MPKIDRPKKDAKNKVPHPKKPMTVSEVYDLLDRERTALMGIISQAQDRVRAINDLTSQMATRGFAESVLGNDDIPF